MRCVTFLNGKPRLIPNLHGMPAFKMVSDHVHELKYYQHTLLILLLVGYGALVFARWNATAAPAAETAGIRIQTIGRELP